MTICDDCKGDTPKRVRCHICRALLCRGCRDTGLHEEERHRYPAMVEKITHYRRLPDPYLAHEAVCIAETLYAGGDDERSAILSVIAERLEGRVRDMRSSA